MEVDVDDSGEQRARLPAVFGRLLDAQLAHLRPGQLAQVVVEHVGQLGDQLLRAFTFDSNDPTRRSHPMRAYTGA